eukprot:14936040-Heterocapsa_arctica.AAC.1
MHWLCASTMPSRRDPCTRYLDMFNRLALPALPASRFFGIEVLEEIVRLRRGTNWPEWRTVSCGSASGP